MRLHTTENTYVTTNNSLYISDDLSVIKAYSYDWWQYVATDAAGNIYFQDCYYSSSTSTHQGIVKDILRCLGLPISFHFLYTSCGFHVGIDTVFEKEIEALQEKIAELEEQINTPRSHRRKNLERENEIRDYYSRIAEVQNFRDRYYNKEKFTPEVSDKDLHLMRPNYYTAIGENDKLLMEILQRKSPYSFRYHGSTLLKVKDLMELRKLLGATKDQLSTLDIVVYGRSKQLLELLREEHNDKLVKTKIARYAVNGYNTFTLEKIFCYLKDRVARRELKGG